MSDRLLLLRVELLRLRLRDDPRQSRLLLALLRESHRVALQRREEGGVVEVEVEVEVEEVVAVAPITCAASSSSRNVAIVSLCVAA